MCSLLTNVLNLKIMNSLLPLIWTLKYRWFIIKTSTLTRTITFILTTRRLISRNPNRLRHFAKQTTFKGMSLSSIPLHWFGGLQSKGHVYILSLCFISIPLNVMHQFPYVLEQKTCPLVLCTVTLVWLTIYDLTTTTVTTGSLYRNDSVDAKCHNVRCVWIHVTY